MGAGILLSLVTAGTPFLVPHGPAIYLPPSRRAKTVVAFEFTPPWHWSPLGARLVSRAGRNIRPTVALGAPLFGKALVERTKIDHNSLVGSAADLLYAVARRHPEVNSLSLDVDY